MSHDSTDCNPVLQLCVGIGRKLVYSKAAFKQRASSRMEGFKMAWFAKLILSLVFGNLIAKLLDKVIR